MGLSRIKIDERHAGKDCQPETAQRPQSVPPRRSVTAVTQGGVLGRRVCALRYGGRQVET